MRRPNPSCANAICGPVLRKIESRIGCWAGATCGYNYIQLAEIMRAKVSLWQPTISKPQVETGPLSLVPCGDTAGYSKEAAWRFWRWLRREGRVPTRYEWEDR